jgi:hypothetical protein
MRMALLASTGCRPISCGHVAEGHTVDDCGSGPGIRVATDRHRYAEQIARAYKTHHDLLAVRRNLGNAQTPMQQQKVRMCNLILGEDRHALGVVAGMCAG